MLFSPNNDSLLAIDRDSCLNLWDVNQSRLICRDHVTGVLTATFFADGKRVALGCAKGPVFIWDIEKRKTIAEFLGHRHDIAQLLLTSDQSQLISVGELTVKGMEIKVWDIDRQSLEKSFFGSAWKRPIASSLSADSKTLLLVVTDSRDQAATFLEQVDLTAAKVVSSARLMAPTGLAKLCQNNTRMVAFHDSPNRFSAYAVPELKELGKTDDAGGVPQFLVVTKDGKIAMSCPLNGPLTLWSTDPPRLLQEAKLPDGEYHTGTFSPNGKLISVAGGYRRPNVRRGDEVAVEPLILVFDVATAGLVTRLPRGPN
jgi:hypothetical protein